MLVGPKGNASSSRRAIISPTRAAAASDGAASEASDAAIARFSKPIRRTLISEPEIRFHLTISNLVQSTLPEVSSTLPKRLYLPPELRLPSLSMTYPNANPSIHISTPKCTQSVIRTRIYSQIAALGHFSRDLPSTATYQKHQNSSVSLTNHTVYTYSTPLTT